MPRDQKQRTINIPAVSRPAQTREVNVASVKYTLHTEDDEDAGVVAGELDTVQVIVRASDGWKHVENADTPIECRALLAAHGVKLTAS